jgi:hypothetical protein
MMLAPKQAAARLGVSVRALEEWRARGVGPVYYRLGRLIQYKASDLDAFVASSRVEPEQFTLPLSEALERLRRRRVERCGAMGVADLPLFGRFAA